MKLILQSVRQLLLWTIVAGGLYPLVITVIAQTAFRHQANGSLVERDGQNDRFGAARAAVPGQQLLLAAALGVQLWHGADGHHALQRQQPWANQRRAANQRH